MLDVEFVVHGDPVGKARARKGKGGRFYTPPKTAEYERRIKQTAQAAMAGQSKAVGPVLVELTLFFALPSRTRKKYRVTGPHTKKPDIDNVAKCLLDGMQGLVYYDDKQVCSLSVAKIQKPIDDGFVLVRVVEMTDE